jgi:hypothetical protein
MTNMALLTQPAFGPKLSIGLILGGALLDIWTLVWRYTLAGDPLTEGQRFWYLGLLLTGITLLVVGLFLGQIGRAARKAELPPPEAQTQEAAIQQTAAANPAPAVNGQLMAPPPGTVVTPAAAGMPMPAAPHSTAAPTAVITAPQQPVAGVRR